MLIGASQSCQGPAQQQPKVQCLCAGVFFVPAFSGLLAPHWRSDARGVILGLSSYSSKGHIVRALLEAITWQVSLPAL